MTKGSRNLLILGLLSIVVALTTTSVTLAIYHNSGDIYLDRSRPGFLPDKDEIESNQDEYTSDYVLDDNTTLTTEVIDDYLENFQKEVNNIDVYKNPFNETGLSDSRLGI